jgi:hypothetical protein
MKKQKLSPGEILKLSGAHWQSCALHAAVRIGVFEELTDLPARIDDLASRLDANPDALGRLLGALAGMGFTERVNDGFRATETALLYLSREAPESVASMVMHHANLASSWTELHRSIQTGRRVRESMSHSDATTRHAFLMGMFDQAMLVAPDLVPGINLSKRKWLLDLGGGPGTYALQFCARNPSLSATVFDLPTSETVATQIIARFEMQDRVQFKGGDFLVDALPNGYDVVWISHILHSFDKKTCQELLVRVTESLLDGGAILIHDFILDEDRSSPPFPALFSLNMLLGTDGGRCYSQPEIETMLSSCGAKRIRRLPITGRNDSGVIEGVF